MTLNAFSRYSLFDHCFLLVKITNDPQRENKKNNRGSKGKIKKFFTGLKKY